MERFAVQAQKVKIKEKKAFFEPEIKRKWRQNKIAFNEGKILPFIPIINLEHRIHFTHFYAAQKRELAVLFY